LIFDFDDILVASSLNENSPVKGDKMILRPHTIDMLKSLQKIPHLKIGLYSENYYQKSYIKEIFFGHRLKWLSKSEVMKNEKKNFKKIRKIFGNHDA
jgi:hypothetical protein